MQKRLEKAIKELAKINGNNLVKSDADTVEKVVKVLGENMPSQLKEWYSVYNGGWIGRNAEFYSTDRHHENITSKLFTLEEMNTTEYKKENQIDKDFVQFAILNDGTLVGYDITKNSETIYIYDVEEGAAIVSFKDMAEFIENEVQNFFLMEDAFEIYFNKLLDNYLTYNNSNPKAQYSEKLKNDLMLSQPDENGEVEWLPARIDEELDLYDVEEDLGFSLFGDLPDYYTKFLFLNLSGYVNKRTYLRFNPLSSKDILPQLIKAQFEAGQEVFPNTQIFLLGMATVGGDGNYGIYFDNRKNVIFLYNPENKKKVKLGNLAYAVATMSLN